MVQRANLHRADGKSTKRGGEGRFPDRPVAGVGDDENIGGKFGPVLLQQLGKTPPRPDLLITLNEHSDADGRLAVECAQCGQVDCETALVIAGALAEQPVLNLCCRKRRRTPTCG